MLKGIQGSPRKHAHLPHVASQHASVVSGPFDEVTAADEHSTRGAAESLAQTNGHGVEESCQIRRLTPVVHDGIEDPGSVNVDSGAIVVGKLADSLKLLQRVNVAVESGILQEHQLCIGVHFVHLGSTEGLLHVDQRKKASLGLDLCCLQSRYHSHSSPFPLDKVRIARSHHFVRWSGRRKYPCQVAHRRRGRPHRRFLPKQLCHLLLQLIDCGIIMENIIP